MSCERRLLSNEDTAKKLTDQTIEVSRLKVEKSPLVEKLKCSVEVKKEIRGTLSAEYKLLLETNNLKCRGIVNDASLQLAKQKLVISGGEDRLRTAQIEVTSLRDKAKKYDDIVAKGAVSMISMNDFNEKAEVR